MFPGISADGNVFRSGPLGGVKNLRVTDPTMTSLNVDWEAADGAVRLYKVFYVPVAGGQEDMVRNTVSFKRKGIGLQI